ncbi:hypothetical protein RJ639_008057 [Escallonia herrerae]|uniref:Reverse transcriptase/retrotransposon-derived protein RNase H-like domain-containing protein n=1 Tax=Escallonia herrerae TaxID=1293975 RepID=A0AA88VU92_9ASTE|nr:hypothetical protein RJ639_008057 [Escallonia herrerae]
MPGIHPEVITHRLNVDPSKKPVKQKKRTFSPERQEKIEEEVGKLLKANFIEKIYYPDWIANVVMVPKPGDKWRICIDYIYLNKKSFEELKIYLGSSPLLSKPIPGEDLFLYLSVTEVTVSAVLVREEDGVQKPIYYVSKVLQDVEARYPKINKIALALITSARRLRPFLQSHTILEITKPEMKEWLSISIHQIPRDQNIQADTLSRLASTKVTEVQRSIYLEFLKERSINSQDEIGVVDEEPNWMDPIIKYLST